MISLKCLHCGSDKLARNGLTQNGKQRYLCSACGRRSRDNPQPNGYTAEERERILRAYHERSSLRGLSRTLAGQLVKSSGRASLSFIAVDTVSATSGRHTS
jgi:transposase-like protein